MVYRVVREASVPRHPISSDLLMVGIPDVADAISTELLNLIAVGFVFHKLRQVLPDGFQAPF